MNLDTFQNFFELFTVAIDMKKDIIVQMQNGSTYHGIPTKVGNEHLVLKPMPGKSYYNIFISLKYICAVEVKSGD